MAQLKDYINLNSNFQNSINLYLDLNNIQKINSYIPTKSSVNILDQYLTAVLDNKQQATLLIGPYGKGKSHLLLLLLAVLSLERNTENKKIVNALIKRIKDTDKGVAEKVSDVWKNKGRFLPVLIMSTQGDLNQAFMIGLNEALKREGLTELSPETYFTYAVDKINQWENEYPDTYKSYKELLKQHNITGKDMMKGLRGYDNDFLDVFKDIFPNLSSGEPFNPLVNSEVQPMFKNIADKLRDDYGYSGIYIIFDEFSKYIEGQDKKTSGNNMKILQDVCELANNSKESQVFITMVAHKSIKEYGKYLSVDTINSFTGIDGRIDEVFFVTSTKNNYDLIRNAIEKDTDKLAKDKHVIPYWDSEVIDRHYEMKAFSMELLREDFEETVVKGCYPLSPTSAYLLLNISEKVAQNERTLFTFVSKDEQYSMANYINNATARSKWIIDADLIYDYFKNLFKKDVMNEYIHNEWLNAEYVLSNIKDENEIKIIKTLAIINIVNKPDEVIANEKYIELASGVDDVSKTLGKLEKDGYIYKKGSTQCYVFKTRATSELKTEIKKRRDIKGGRVNINGVLNQVSEIKYILPREYNTNFSITRYFRYEYMDVEDFLGINDFNVIFQDGNFCDGKVVALYSKKDNDYTNQIVEKLQNNNIQKLVVIYGRTVLNVLEQIEEYEVVQELKNDIVFFNQDENKVLQKEIPVIEEDLGKEIECYLQNNFGSGNNSIFYIDRNQVVYEEDYRLSDIVNHLCREIYSIAFSVRSELINKEEVKTGAIKTARKNIITKLLNKEDFSDDLDKTSVDATLFRALFTSNGIYDDTAGESVRYVLDVYNQFINDAADDKRLMTELIDELTSAPIGMRRGVIPVYLAYVISNRKEDIIVYFGDKEVSVTADIILNMCSYPKDYSIYVSSEDVEKEKYISGLGELYKIAELDNQQDSRISIIVYNMQKWFRALPQVTKNIRKQDKYFGNEVLAKAYTSYKKLMQDIEPNPYEILFIDLPKVFNTDTDYEELLRLLDQMKSKLQKYYDYLRKETIHVTIDIFNAKSKQDLKHTLLEWYGKQSDLAKNGLHSKRITDFLGCITNNKSYSDVDVIEKVAKAVTEIYMDSWNDTTYSGYLDSLKSLKEEIEAINDNGQNRGKYELSFVGKKGEIKKYYEPVNEGTGSILRSMISDALEDFSDLSVNDKIAILLEMIENQLGG